MSRPDLDPVALWIAATVQHHLITSPTERPDLPPLPERVTAVEAHPVGELDTGVVVTTAGRVRYFLVRVQESDHRQTADRPGWQARRRDGRGGWITARDAEALLVAIRADYERCPGAPRRALITEAGPP